MKTSRAAWGGSFLAALVSGQASETNSGKVHVVTVGKADHQFQPNSFQAEAGDIIQFEFFPPNHSVVRAEYQQPCIPYEYTGENKTGFFSGFFPVDRILSDPPTWNLTINDTEPIFLYCSAPGSCIDQQMVAVINPNTSSDLVRQKQAAAESSYMLNPGEPFPSEDEGNPSSEAKSSSTTSKPTGNPSSTATQTAAAAASAGSSEISKSSPHLSGGAIAGIVIAVLFVIGLVGALLFLLGRHKTLLQFTKHQRHASYQGSYRPPSPMSESGMTSPAFPVPPRDVKDYRFPSSPPAKPGFSVTDHPAFANGEYVESEAGYGAPPYSPLAMSPPHPPRQIHIAELAARTDNASAAATAPRSSSKRHPSRSDSRMSDRDRSQHQPSRQNSQPQQQQRREEERPGRRQRSKEGNSWLNMPLSRPGDRKISQGSRPGAVERSRSGGNELSVENLSPISTSDSSERQPAPDSPTLGSPRRR